MRDGQQARRGVNSSFFVQSGAPSRWRPRRCEQRSALVTVNVKIETAGPCRKTLHVEVAVDAVREAYGEVLGVFARQAQIKGFRPGKAPLAMVERQHRTSMLKDCLLYTSDAAD